MVTLYILIGSAILIFTLAILQKIIIKSVDISETNELVKKILENQESEKKK